MRTRYAAELRKYVWSVRSMSHPQVLVNDVRLFAQRG